MSVRNISAISMVFVLALCVGCSSDGKATQGEKTVRNFNKTTHTLRTAQQQIDETLQAMDQFQFTGNLQDQFRAYKKSVKDLEKTSEEAKSLARSMNEHSEKYKETWEKDMAKVKDSSVRASVESRQQAVKSNVDALRTSAEAARAAYEPFMAGLKDIEQALSINLSRGALPGLKPAMDKAHADGKTLKAKIAAMQNQLSNIEQGRAATAAK